jgi:hypothetical protein
MNSRSQFDTGTPFVSSHLFGLGIFFFLLYVTVRAVTMGPMSAVTPMAGFGIVMWFFTARSYWWLPVPLALAFGGVLWLGFKIYTYEIAMVLALLALAPMLALKVRMRGIGPARVPVLIWLLLAYLLAETGRAIFLNHSARHTGTSHLLRSYGAALWAPLFAILFYQYGSIRHVKLVMKLIFGILLVRSALGFLQIYSPDILYLNLFGSYLLLAPGGATEMRVTGLHLIILSCSFFFMTRRVSLRILLVLMALLAAWLTLVGSGRVTIVMLLVIPLLVLFFQRRYVLLGVSGAVIGFGLLLLNLHATFIESLPDYAERALSALVFTQKLDIHASLRLGDEWHYTLMRLGYQNWTESPLTFFFGRPIEPFDESFYAVTASFAEQVDIAARTARYESALWTNLASLGLFGVLLIVALYTKLLRDPFRELMRRGCVDFETCFYFYAVCHVVLFVAFSWIAGGFPGYELAVAAMAKSLYDDKVLAKYRQERAAAQPDVTPKKRVTTMFAPI